MTAAAVAKASADSLLLRLASSRSSLRTSARRRVASVRLALATAPLAPHSALSFTRPRNTPQQAALGRSPLLPPASAKAGHVRSPLMRAHKHGRFSDHGPPN